MFPTLTFSNLSVQSGLPPPNVLIYYKGKIKSVDLSTKRIKYVLGVSFCTTNPLDSIVARLLSGGKCMHCSILEYVCHQLPFIRVSDQCPLPPLTFESEPWWIAVDSKHWTDTHGELLAASYTQALEAVLNQSDPPMTCSYSTVIRYNGFVQYELRLST